MMNLMRFARRPIFSTFGKVDWKVFYVSRSGLCSASSLADVRFRPLNKPRREVTKKLPRPPFVPGFFCSEIDEVMFEYPEVDDQHLTHIKELASVVQNFYDTRVHIPEVKNLNKIPDDVLSDLKSLGVFGLTVPRVYGGLELGAVELNCIAEVLSQNLAIFHMINFHNNYGVHILLEAGTELQKQTYLPKLSSGEMMFGVCFWEKNCGTDLLCTETRAIPLDSKTYVLCGSKKWVSNVDSADSLLVLADTRMTDTPDPELTLFIVDKNSPGISIKPMEKDCLEKLGMFEVSFDSTIVTRDDIVGSEGGAFELTNGSISEARTCLPSAVIQTVRSLLDQVIHHVIHREQFGQPLFNYDLIKWKIAQASMKLYVLESTVYMTAGFYDLYEKQNLRAETAITNVCALETLQHCLSIISEVFSSRLFDDVDLLSQFKDAQFFSVSEGTKDMHKLNLALTCLRILGEGVHDRVVKLRNPLQFPLERLKNVYFSYQQFKDDPKIRDLVSNNVHPSLKTAADTVEYCIYRLGWAAELNVIHYGVEITKHQHILIGLADLATECYGMSAAIARASRSYCTGMKNCEADMLAAHVYTTEQLGKVRRKVEYLDPHNRPVQVESIHQMLEVIGSSKQYFAVHPTERNYA